MRPLAEAIARTEVQLPFIPTAMLRQMRVLALLDEQTASTFPSSTLWRTTVGRSQIMYTCRLLGV